MDEYVDKVYEQFISEGGRAQRTVLKEERAKLKAESVAAAPRYKYRLYPARISEGGARAAHRPQGGARQAES